MLIKLTIVLGKGPKPKKYCDERQFLAGIWIFYKFLGGLSPHKFHPIDNFLTYVNTQYVYVWGNLNFKASLHFFESLRPLDVIEFVGSGVLTC